MCDVCDGCEALQEELNEARAKLYAFAKHLRNGQQMDIARWATQSMRLLADLREMDPVRYDVEVKGHTPTDTVTIDAQATP